MAKNTIRDWSTTAASNTDVGGIGIQGTDSAGNVGPALREMMKQVADVNQGNEPLDDTFSVANADDVTKVANFDCSNIPTATTRSLDPEALNRNGAFTETRYTASGTHTFAAQSRWFQVTAVASGGGGGLADGQGSSTYAAAGGGGSGQFGISNVLSVLAITADGSGNRTSTITIGAAGASATDGGDTVWSDGVNTLTWKGGKAGQESIGNSGTSGRGKESSSSVTQAGLIAASNRGGGGWIADTVYSGGIAGQRPCVGGVGGDSPFGSGGLGGDTNNGAAAGSDALGYGGGGGGGVASNTSANGAGGSGSKGILIVREW